MNTYLNGYLASIPKSERDKILYFLEKHMTDKLNINEEEFKLLMNQLENMQEITSKMVKAKQDEKPVNTYNQIYKNVYFDLVYLFKLVDALSSAIESYGYLSESYLSDIQSELNKLESRIIELKSKRENDNNTIVITETFKDTESFEKPDPENLYLFVDRNGQQLPLVDMVHNNTHDMIALKVNNSEDLLHNKEGKTIASIEVLDFRGIPSDTYCLSKDAIDNSETTYWDCTTITGEPINIPMDELEAGGAYIKFKIRLAKAQKISEIAISPYCVYPVEIAKIIINNEDIINKISNPNNSSTETMTFGIEPISADEITIVLRQKNYIYEVLSSNKKNDEAQELLNRVLNIKKESYIENKDPASVYPDEELYNIYSSKYEKEITSWNNKFMREV